ncbi:TIM barrel protein [Solicola gregarius]|uniref:TIM barrel protein n=1 Tax=Solicola gregarius TaxID=2908642 RepID=A0AA46TJA2_9ACTN|nr:TIM barrel protein [Solicola gregarius]UYM06346.1 TIM barrel protein [Solicola gregarius]
MADQIELALHSYSRRLRFVHDPDYDVFTFIDEAARRGFAGVNISLSGPDNAHLPPHRHLGGNTPAHLSAVADALRSRGMSVEVDTDTVQPDRLQTAITIAGALGARVLRTFTHHCEPDVLAKTTHELALSRLAAEAADVVVAVENHEEFTSAELVRLVENVDSPHVRLLFDYGNSLPVLEPPAVALASMLPYVVACHLKDVAMISADDSPDSVPATMGVPLGHGHIPVESLTRTLVTGRIRRLALQNVWGYHVPLGKLRPIDPNDPRLGEGDFAYIRPPFSPPIVCFHPESVYTPEQLMALEDHALDVATRNAITLCQRITGGRPSPDEPVSGNRGARS